MPTRRALIFTLAAAPIAARAAALPEGFRGALDATDFGVMPQTKGNQTKAFQALLREAQRRRLPVILPPGDYRLSGIALHDGLTLSGTPGATRLMAAGPGPILTAERQESLTLSGLILDARSAESLHAGRGTLDIRETANLRLDNCAIEGSRLGDGIRLERCGGRIRDNDIRGAGGVGLFAIDSRGLSITGNTVSACGNGGILVHRSQEGEDGTIVTGNRVFDISANDGGTGQNGNGINIFRAGNVIVTGNQVSDCAFSAIRANEASNVVISTNQCLRSGETAIYSEFGFQGAVVTGNVIDTAANGILIVNFDVGGRLATVGQNVIRNITGIGPYVHDGAGFGFGISVEADTAVTGNVIEQVAKWGMVLGWGPYLRNVSVTGNIVRNAPLGCAVTVVEDAGTALLADNLFQGVKDAIVGFRWTERATGDLLDGPADAFAHLTMAGNRRVS
jgi:uncharacterized secreted repeat protein (TIGR03808 family)